MIACSADRRSSPVIAREKTVMRMMLKTMLAGALVALAGGGAFRGSQCGELRTV